MPPRLQPPPHLNDDERSLFDELVGACDPRHFVESDLPLLASYVQATLIARDAARAPSKIVLWEKAVRMQATLATRLRLSPQSRIDRKFNVTRPIAPFAGSHVWLRRPSAKSVCRIYGSHWPHPDPTRRV
jgi:hypothetical protein